MSDKFPSPFDLLGGNPKAKRSEPKPRMKKKADPNSLGSQLSEARVKGGYTQTEVAERVGMNIDTLRKIEAGNEGVSLRNILKLSNFLFLSLKLEKKSI